MRKKLNHMLDGQQFRSSLKRQERLKRKLVKMNLMFTPRAPKELHLNRFCGGHTYLVDSLSMISS
jgi:hypothetical protein